jgi:hypothetical protein
MGNIGGTRATEVGVFVLRMDIAGTHADVGMRMHACGFMGNIGGGSRAKEVRVHVLRMEPLGGMHMLAPLSWAENTHIWLEVAHNTGHQQELCIWQMHGTTSLDCHLGSTCALLSHKVRRYACGQCMHCMRRLHLQCMHHRRTWHCLA